MISITWPLSLIASRDSINLSEYWLRCYHLFDLLIEIFSIITHVENVYTIGGFYILLIEKCDKL